MLNNIKKDLKSNGGLTLNAKDLSNANLKAGYMVSLKGYEIITTIDDLTINALIAHANKAYTLGGYVGLWLNKGKLYIDISLNIKSLEEALKVAKLNNQIAIYDIANNKEIIL